MPKSTFLSHSSQEAHCPCPGFRKAAFLQGSTWLLKAPHSVEAVSNYCNELKSFFSNYCGILEIMTQLLLALKCQADHSEIQTRFLQEGPNDKTFDEPSVLALVALLRWLPNTFTG